MMVACAMVVAYATLTPPLQAQAQYHAMAMTGPRAVARLRASLGPSRYRIVLAINRLDAEHAARADTLIVPEDGFFDLAALSPWPDVIEPARTIPRMLLVSLRTQSFAAYEDGQRVRWGPVSSGGPNAPTPTGVFRANWKSRVRVSNEDETWIMPWYVNIDDRRGVALHQYGLPGRPSSHRCIRLAADDARWVYDWVAPRTRSRGGIQSRGTPVLVFGRYAFGGRPPWRRLPVDPGATAVSTSRLAEVLATLELTARE